MTPSQFLPLAVKAAEESGHVWPEYAACEAALESNWGESRLAKFGNNLFGRKVSKNWTGQTLSIKTWEDLNRDGQREPEEIVDARWAKFNSWDECFRDRMAVLTALAPKFPDYAVALDAKDGESFVINVSRTWATDPNRAAKVLQIHRAHFPNA